MKNTFVIAGRYRSIPRYITPKWCARTNQNVDFNFGALVSGYPILWSWSCCRLQNPLGAKETLLKTPITTAT